MEHISTWEIRLHVFEHDDDSTTAHVTLHTGANTLRGEGHARKRPSDPAVAEIGDELAVGRALIHLGTQLMDAASEDLAALAQPLERA